MVAVDKVDVSESGRSKQNCVAQRVAGSRVSRRIILAEIGLHFYNAGRKEYTSFPPDQNFAQELARHPARITGKERALERTNASSFM